MTLWFWGAFVLGAFWPDTLPEPGDERSRWVQFLFARAAHNFTDLKQTDATRDSTPWSTALASPVWRNLAAAQSVLELKERPFVTLYYSREPTESQSFILWSILPKPAKWHCHSSLQQRLPATEEPSIRGIFVFQEELKSHTLANFECWNINLLADLSEVISIII